MPQFISGYMGQRVTKKKEKKKSVVPARKKTVTFIVGNTRKKKTSCDLLDCNQVRRCYSAGDGIEISPDGVITNTGVTEVTCEAVEICMADSMALKQDVIIGGASTIVSVDLTASRLLVSNGSGKVAVSTVTATEAGYLSGVTSAIQTQLNAKLTNVLTTTGDIIYSSSGTTAARLAIGGANTVLHGGTTPSYSAVVEADITLADNTTNDATTARHGFLKKLSNVATEYMDGTGNWSVPAGAGTSYTAIGRVSTGPSYSVAVSSTTAYKIAFGSAHGTNSADINTSTDRWTCPTTAEYSIDVFINFSLSNVANFDRVSCYVKKNGSTDYGIVNHDVSEEDYYCIGKYVGSFTAADYIEVYIEGTTNSGGSCSMLVRGSNGASGNAFGSYFMVKKI